MIIQTIYQKPKVGFLFLLETTNMLYNSPLNRVDFQLLQNQHNKLTFFVKNSDRKSVNLLGQTPIFKIVQPKLNYVIFEKPMTVENDYEGKVSIIIDNSDTVNWELGYLSYHVSLINDGIETYLYTDQNNNTSGWLELIKNPAPKTLFPKTFNWISSDVLEMSTIVWTSDKLPGAAKAWYDKTVQSVQITLDNFIGTITMQATLDPMGNSDWFDLDINPFDDNDDLVINESSTGTTGYEISGSFEFVRFKYHGNTVPEIKLLTY